MIAQEIMKAFNYVGYQDFINEDYQMTIKPNKAFRELTIFVPEQRYGRSEIHFFRKSSFWNSHPETFSGVARAFDNYVLLIANGHVYIIKDGQIILDEEI